MKSYTREILEDTIFLLLALALLKYIPLLLLKL